MSDLPKLISIKKAAQILGVTPLTLRNWDRNGKLPALRHPMNNYRVYKREDVEKIIASAQFVVRPPKPPKKSGPQKLQVKHLEE